MYKKSYKKYFIKYHLIFFKYNIFEITNFSKIICEYIRTEKLSNKIP